MVIIVFVIVIVLLCSILFVLNLHSKYDYFKIRSIPTPPFRFFFGHYKTIWSTPSISRQYQRWSRMYGSIYGLFEGSRPVYVSSNVDFLNEVFIKQFSSFHSRRLPFITRLSNGNHIHLFGADGDRWRGQRHIMNPTFSNVKLKLMLPLINKCLDLFMRKIELHGEKELNICEFYKQLTMDVICRCAFGIDTDVQDNRNNSFLIKSSQFFADNHEKLFIVKLSYLMPWLIPLLTRLIGLQMAIFHTMRLLVPSLMNRFEELPGFWIINQVKNVINQRISKSNDSSRIDLLQLLLNATDTQENSSSNRSGKLHYDEVTSNVFLFMIAGFGTTSTTLANCSYMLAKRADIQETLRANVDALGLDGSEANDFDRINNCEYLDWFVREILRMYPIAVQAISRECNQETSIDGYRIEKGDVIQPDIFSLHYDRDLWGPEDPEKFFPERHSTRRHPMAFMAFGQGPRNCIGTRFALMEIKLCLTRLLQRFIILPTEKTESNFIIRETLVIEPDAVYIQLKQRA